MRVVVELAETQFQQAQKLTWLASFVLDLSKGIRSVAWSANGNIFCERNRIIHRRSLSSMKRAVLASRHQPNARN